MMQFIYSLQSEWIKTRRSAASWLAIIGGFFIPTIMTFATLYSKATLNRIGIGAWQEHFMNCWQSMAVFLLPMGIVLASSLITQMEFKNNTWKQLHTTPQSFTQIFFAKFTVILLMTVKFFIYFNIGIILSGIIPCLILDGEMPNTSIPVAIFLKQNGLFLITVLPILAIQYLISLQFKNFLVPIGIGMLFLIGSTIGMRWEHIYVSPYSYSVLKVVPFPIKFDLYTYAIIYFLVIMIISYYLYLNKKEKG